MTELTASFIGTTRQTNSRNYHDTLSIARLENHNLSVNIVQQAQTISYSLGLCLTPTEATSTMALTSSTPELLAGPR